MRVALVNPPQVFSRFQVAAGITPPLGLAYLASFLEAASVDVVIVDALGAAPAQVTPFRDEALLRGWDLDQTVAAIPEDAELVGISNLFTFAWPVVSELTARIRARFPDVPVVVGGPHPSALPEECLQEPGVDFVISGEGELPLLALCHALAGQGDGDGDGDGDGNGDDGDGDEGSDADGDGDRDGADPYDIDGLSYLDEDGNAVIRPPTRQQLPPVAELSFPARHLLPMETYCTIQEAHGPVGGSWTSILSSRGCPYGCTFCSSRHTLWRPRPAAHVVDEIEHCMERWGIQEFHFEDDNMTIDRDRIIAIAEELKRRDLKIRWQTPNGIRASVTDKITLKAMRDSGCEHVTLAPESGSPRVLKEVIKKGGDFDLDQLLRVAVEAGELGMKVAAYFIIGLPGETEAEVEQTIEYAKRLARAGVDEVSFSLFTPLPGTPLWSVVAERGIELDYLDLLTIDDLKNSVSFSSELDADDLRRLRRKAYVSFFVTRARHHPRAFARTFANVIVERQETKTDRVLISLVQRFVNRTGLTEGDGDGDGDRGGSKSGSRPVLAYPYDAARTLRMLLRGDSGHAFRGSLRKALKLLTARSSS